MTERAGPSRLTLVLTNRCNMNCSYCYERTSEPADMSCETARAGADIAFSGSGRDVELTFYGGEPLLEFETIRRVVEHVRHSLTRRQRVRFWLVTNGTLIDGNVWDFLAGHDFTVQVSFDGVPGAQRLRGDGTFERLERTLDSMRDTRPEHFRRRVEVSITVSPEAVPLLAESIDFFLAMGVPQIDLTPVITPSSGWSNELVGVLEEQFGRVLRSSVAHFERTGRVPLKLYSGEEPPAGTKTERRAMCEIVSGNSWSVDPDGTVSGCVLFAPSIQAYGSDLLRDCRSTMVVGNVFDSEIAEKMAAFGEKVTLLPIVSKKEKKYSSFRKCADCRFFSVCVTCPASIGFVDANTDPHRVPDYYCAFNYTALASRDGFPVQPTDLEVVRGDNYRELREKWKAIGDEARRASPPESSS